MPRVTTSQKMVATWWGFLGLVITAIAVPVAIATPHVAAWAGLAAGAVLAGLVALSLAKGWAIFGDGTSWDGAGGAGGAGGSGGYGGSGCCVNRSP